MDARVSGDCLRSFSTYGHSDQGITCHIHTMVKFNGGEMFGLWLYALFNKIGE